MLLDTPDDALVSVQGSQGPGFCGRLVEVQKKIRTRCLERRRLRSEPLGPSMPSLSRFRRDAGRRKGGLLPKTGELNASIGMPPHDSEPIAVPLVPYSSPFWGLA